MKRFIFLDIDGTLVDSANHRKITQSTTDAIREARENGCLVFICSGRNWFGLEEYRDMDFDGFIYSDGAGIRIKGHEPVMSPIEEHLLDEMLDTVINKLGGDVMMAADEYYYATGIQYDLWSEATIMYPSLVERLRRPQERINDPVLEVDVELPDAEAEKMFIETLSPHLEYISTTANYGREGRSAGEVTMYGITKGEGIRTVVALLGGNMDNTYGFGDSMNDASMLKTCAYGICMGNGAQELKELADYVTDDINDDGLANAFRHFGLTG